MATAGLLDGTEASNNVGGSPPALKPEHIAILHDIVTERAQASLQKFRVLVQTLISARMTAFAQHA